MSAPTAPAIHFDKSQRPLIRVRLAGRPTRDEVVAHLKQMDGLLAENQRYGMVVDMREAGASEKPGPELWAAWMKKNQATIERLTVGSAIVVKGTLARTALSAVLWMQPIPGPYAIFADVKSAEKWLHDRLREARLPVLASESVDPHLVNEG